MTITNDIELPYITTGEELKQATLGMAQELLWRLVGYDARPATEDDVAVVLAALTEARAEFVKQATAELWPVTEERIQLRLVREAG